MWPHWHYPLETEPCSEKGWESDAVNTQWVFYPRPSIRCLHPSDICFPLIQKPQGRATHRPQRLSKWHGLFADGCCCQPSLSTRARKGNAAPPAPQGANPSLKTPASILALSLALERREEKPRFPPLSVLPSLLPSHGRRAFLRMWLLPASPPCQGPTGSNIPPGASRAAKGQQPAA